MNNYTVYHLHDDTSNCNGFADSTTKYSEYIKRAKELNMSAIAFSNHGGIYDWVSKKQSCDKNGIKYIHGVELYLCTSLEANERGYHIGLYAKNIDGVKELNLLLSNATLKGTKEDNSDRHFYFNPRISIEELKNTSDNIIITTACLMSILWKEKDNYGLINDLLSFMSKNNHRCFLEIQYHNHKDQIEFNKLLYNHSEKYDIPLIAGTDTHSLNEYSAECRKILQISKDSFYGDEDSFDLTFKTYDELIELFRTQNAIPEEAYIKAIHNTNVLANMCENFHLNYDFKYPNLYGDESDKLWINTIRSKFNKKLENGFIPKDLSEEYKNRINEEYVAMKSQGMSSFMLFMSELSDYCELNDIPRGFARGSVAGSLIAYITDITDVDAIKWNTVFSRFCNADRISLADIDIDFAPEDRAKVYEYIINRFTPQKTSYIAQFGTVKDRGTIDVISKGLKYDLAETKIIKNKYESILDAYSKTVQENIDLDEFEYGSTIDFDLHDKYVYIISNKDAIKKLNELISELNELKINNKDLFYYFEGIQKTIISKGSHSAGIIGSPITLADNLGVFYKDGDTNMPVSTCAMKAVDSLNYVKFDILGLKTLGVIKDTIKYINKKYPKSHEIDWYDNEVWAHMLDSNVGVFQMEGDYAFSLLKKFKPNKLSDMSLVNASLRPSGKSYRDKLINREFHKNPSEKIDELLKDNYGWLVYQEDTIKFLTDICGMDGASSDTIRRCVHEDTLITMGNGNYKKIKDINIGEYVQSFGEHNQSQPNIVLNKFYNGLKDTYKVTTKHGYDIVATKDHKFLTQRGWIRLDELTLNDFLMTPKNINAVSDGKMSQSREKYDIMFLIGLLIGDGTLGTTKKIRFTNSDNILIDEFKRCVNHLLRNGGDCEFSISEQNGVSVDTIYGISAKTKRYSDSLYNKIKKYSLNKKSNLKIIPDEFMSYPNGDKILSLLGGLFSTDGGYNTQSNAIEYYSASEMLCKQIKSLLSKFGIYSYVCKKHVKGYNYYAYSVMINQINSLRTFENIILPYIKGKKYLDMQNIISNAHMKNWKYNYILPNECKEEILEMSKIMNKSIRSSGNIHQSMYGIEKDVGIHKSDFGISDMKAMNFIQNIYCPITYELLMADYTPIKIKKIEYFKKSKVYDIEVDNNHNYVANDIIVHNCIGKKDHDELQRQLPKVIDAYCNNSLQPVEVAKKEAEEFIQIISDSSSYQFGYNHSHAYSMNGYLSTMLRTYYPIEFVTAYLNRADNESDIQMGTELARMLGIEIKPIKFGMSKSEYRYYKDDNEIYRGISSIKHLSSQVATQLYELRNNKYDSFIDLLKDLNNTSINKRHLDILIKLDFFSEFGKAKKLLDVVEYFNMIYGKKVLNKSKISEDIADIVSKYSRETASQYRDLEHDLILKELCESILDEDISIKEKMDTQKEYLGYIDIRIDTDKLNCVILNLDTKYKPKITIMSLSTGKTVLAKCTKELASTVDVGDIVHIAQMKPELGWTKDRNDKWVKDPNKKEWHIKKMFKIHEKELYDGIISD